MDPVLTFLDSLVFWQFALVFLVLIAISASIGDADFLPWIAIAALITGISDLIGIGPIGQILVFIAATLFLVFYARKSLIYGKTDRDNLVAENINQVVGKEIRIIQVDGKQVDRGSGTLDGGRNYSVRHLEGKKIVIGNKYICHKVEGVTLIIKEE
tara:strand:+ start:859 stop:1326 length:468 start_codon:yes stop_codon:yes gene_type:complete